MHLSACQDAVNVFGEQLVVLGLLGALVLLQQQHSVSTGAPDSTAANP